MPRQSADRLAAREAELLDFRLRSGSGQSSPASGFISTPITNYRVMDPETIETKIERLSLAIDSYKDNYMLLPDWQLGYIASYNSYSKQLVELKESATQRQQATLKDLTSTLEEAKAIMQAADQPTGAQPTEDQPEEVGEKSKDPIINPVVGGVRLLSESSDLYLDTNAEENMLNSLRYLSKGEANLSRVSKLATNVSNVTIGQQHALRVVRADLRAMHASVEHVNSNVVPRIINLESQIVNVQTSLNNTVTSSHQAIQQIEKVVKDAQKQLEERLKALETVVLSTPVPPTLSSTINQTNPILDPESDQSGAALGTPDGIRNTDPTSPEASSTYTAESGNDARKILAENTIKGLITLANKTLSIEINDEMSDQLISECHTKKVPSLHSNYEKLNKALDKYLEICSVYDEDLIELANLTLQKILKWVDRVTDKYDRDEIYNCPSNPKESMTVLEKFNPEGETTVFEFLTKFERKFKGLGSHTEKAEKLWSEYLSDPVKLKTEHVKSNFRDLKVMLTKKYGSMNFILENTLTILEKARSKSNLQYSSRLALYTKVLLMLQKLSDAKDFISVPQETWDNSVYGVSTMDRLIKIMTPSEWDMLACKLTDKDLDTDEVQGRESFELFKMACKTCVNSLTRLAAAEKKNQNPVNSFFQNPPLLFRKGKKIKRERKN